MEQISGEELDENFEEGEPDVFELDNENESDEWSEEGIDEDLDLKKGFYEEGIDR